jgi:hypothetical protein
MSCDDYTKEEYLGWCYGIVQSRSDSDKNQEFFFSDKLLCALKKFCLKEIDNMADGEKETVTLKIEGYNDDVIPSMLYTSDEIDAMKREIDEIWLSIDPKEDNYIQKVNIVSVQCANMFNYHVKNKLDPDRENWRKKVIDINLGKKYKNYADTKNAVLLQGIYGSEEYSGYLNKDDFGVYFLISIEPLFVSHMLDGFFEHKIWFVGFSSRFLKTDGDTWISPFRFIKHDIGHAHNSFSYTFKKNHDYRHNCYDSIYNSNSSTKKGYELVSDFYKYCKQKYQKGSKEGIALQIAIFIAMHEFGLQDDCEIWFGNSSEKDFIDKIKSEMNYKVHRFFNKNDLFGSLPKRIRNTANTATDKPTKEKIITDYLYNEVVENYVKTYTEWQQSLTVGGRKTRKGRRRRNRTNNRRH